MNPWSYWFNRFENLVDEKFICCCSETEAKDHHRLLDDVGGDFDTSSGKIR